jgi:6-phosphogluconolactonase
MTDLVQAMGNGAGPYKDRQEGPHAHMILTNPGAQHVFGVNLGADQILAWDFDHNRGHLTRALCLTGMSCQELGAAI